MSIRFEEIGKRLRAYRLGKNYTADDIAGMIGVSRAAVYRLEKGELVKIQTLEALSELLEVSLPSLLGAEVEYYRNAVALFERMRQLEEDAAHVLGNFAPFSLLLLSDDYMTHLRQMLIELIPAEEGGEPIDEDFVDRVLGLLNERRSAAMRRHTPVVSIVGLHDIQSLLHLGLVGRFDLSGEELRARRLAARAEIEHLIGILERQPIGVQIGIVPGVTAGQTFQIFDGSGGASVSLSPYRFGAHPNIAAGIAMVTSAPETVKMFKDVIKGQWERARKGEAAIATLRRLLDEQPMPGLHT